MVDRPMCRSLRYPRDVQMSSYNNFAAVRARVPDMVRIVTRLVERARRCDLRVFLFRRTHLGTQDTESPCETTFLTDAPWAASTLRSDIHEESALPEPDRAGPPLPTWIGPSRGDITPSYRGFDKCRRQKQVPLPRKPIHAARPSCV